MDENEDMKKELRGLEEEMDEMQDSFRYVLFPKLLVRCSLHFLSNYAILPNNLEILLKILKNLYITL